MTEIYKIKDENDYQSFLEAHKKVCIKFSTECCGPCKSTGENIKSIENTDWAFAEIDCENEEMENVISNSKIRGVPVLLFFKDGKKVLDENGNEVRTNGLRTKEQILEIINKYD